MHNSIMERAMDSYSGYDTGVTKPMTIQGTTTKMLILTAVLLVSFFSVFYQYNLGYTDKVLFLTMAGFIVGFILSLIIIFTRKALPVLVPIYAFCEGLFLGGFSAELNSLYPGIVTQAVTGTIIVFLVMGLLYKTGVIKVTEKVRSVVFVASFALIAVYLLAFFMSLFNYTWLSSMIVASTPVGIALSVLICLLAAYYLLLDFDSIEQAVKMEMPSRYEWLGAFSLTVTLVWLYIEILNLISQIRSR